MHKKVQWQPSASIETLKQRMEIIHNIRNFFAEREVLEVETPILSAYSVTDVQLSTFTTEFIAPFDTNSKQLFLITSPEYHMKRLIAAGIGSIFQIGKVFRNEEAGVYHNPEFTMLEWYRMGFGMHELIAEIDDLLQLILACDKAELASYQNIFIQYVALDPLTASMEQLIAKAEQQGLNNAYDCPRDTLLQFLFTTLVEPQIGKQRPIAVYDFPASQAALAKLVDNDHRVAQRFEFYYQGVELANGFHELTDAKEQLQRFEQDNAERRELGFAEYAIDYNFIASLEHGMPLCSGVALGLDRLIMLKLGLNNIGEAISFTVNNA